MLSPIAQFFAIIAVANAHDTGCYCSKEAGCTAHDGCSCDFSEVGCAAVGATWFTGAVCSCKAPNPTNTESAGCLEADSETCNCDVSEQACAGTWQTTGCASCQDIASKKKRRLQTAGAPPSSSGGGGGSSHSYSSPPPAPPAPCDVPQGDTLSQTTVDIPDPLNEPCYSHSSCKEFGDPSGSGYICCVAVGTCDAMHSSGSPYVSNSARYYEGGCRGVNYRRGPEMMVNSTPTAFPSTDTGCFKQGECALPYLEHSRGWTARGSGLAHASLPPATLERLLVGSTDNVAGACRAPYADMYPPDSSIPQYDTVMVVTVQGDVSTFTPAVLTSIAEIVALQLGVPSNTVSVRVVSGSVVLEVTITSRNQATANSVQAAATAPDGPMSSVSAASTFLTDTRAGGVAVTVASIDNAGTVSATPTAVSDDDDLSTGAIIGIAAGGAVVVLLLAFFSFRCFCSTKTAPAGKSSV